MKTARIVLTAAVLFSLQSTLFCSSEKATKSSTSLTRNDSFDALRDGGPLNGWLGWNPDALAKYTLDHCGEDYKGKKVRIGSQNTAVQAWTEFGQKIDKLEEAKQFLAKIEESNVSLPTEATSKSNEIIAAHRNASENAFIALNQESKDQLRALFVKKTVAIPAARKAIQKKHEGLKKAELNKFYEQCKADDAETAKQLQENLRRLIAMKATHNQEFQNIEDQIRRQNFTQSEQSLSGQGLAATAAKYKIWTAKSVDSYTGAVKSDK